MAKQVRIRRDSSSNLASVTPADSELGHDTTLDELLIGDGSTTGGIPHPNFRSILNNRYIAANAGGTADAITIALTKAPSSYSTYMRVIFKAGSNNTGATTVNVNSLGTKNLQKVSGGSLVALAAGDIVSGGVYEIIYDGTQFQLLTLQNSGITSVSQGDLNTSTGTFSATANTTLSGSIKYGDGNNDVVAPGGEYGFLIQSKHSGTGSISGFFFGTNNESNYTTVLVPWAEGGTVGASLGQQRYITSSPPFDMGDGEAGGFIFLKVNSGGEIVGHYAADVPPWAYNGPTDIRCQHICPLTGNKFRKVMKKRSLEEIMDGAKISYELQEITQAIKNADMDLLPAPFKAGPGETIVMLDPMDDRIASLIEYQNAGGGEEIMKAIASGKIKADNEALQGRKGPKNVMQTRLKFKYSG